MGGFGWTEHFPNCSKARMCGWKEAFNVQHSEQCRGRIEGELSQTEKSTERMEMIKLRHERYAAQMGEKIKRNESVPQPVELEGR